MEAKNSYFSESGAGIGAGIFALGMLARELPKSLRKIEKSAGRFFVERESCIEENETQEIRRESIICCTSE